MKSYTKDNMLVMEGAAGEIAVEVFDRPKEEIPDNAMNAGFFGSYTEGGYPFTLPVAHEAADFDEVSPPLAKYMEERGEVDGCRFRFDSDHWGYCNDFCGKSVSTFIVDGGKAHFSSYVKLPKCDYAISGVPVLRGGKAVSFADAQAEGWSANTLYATRHAFVGVKADGTVVAAMFSTKTANCVSSGEAAEKLLSLGCVDGIKLDGGGSAIMRTGGKTVKTAENRRIHSIIRFGVTPTERLIRTAKGEIGYIEKASASGMDDKLANPGRANWTKYGEWYGINPGAWCAMFVSWCAMKAGMGEDIIPKFASCSVGVAWFKEHGRWVGNNSTGSSLPKAGDIVFFTRDGTSPVHVGIVTAVQDGVIRTVEGNTSGGAELVENGGCAAAKSYAVTSAKILGYGRPAYAKGDTGMMPTLKRGDKTKAVGALQTLMNYRGYPLDVDGSFGGKTRAAVVTMQADKRLEQTGEVGEAEWAALAEG